MSDTTQQACRTLYAAGLACLAIGAVLTDDGPDPVHVPVRVKDE